MRECIDGGCIRGIGKRRPGYRRQRTIGERQTMIGQDHIAIKQTDIRDGLRVAVGIEKSRRNANRKRQRVILRPLDFGHLDRIPVAIVKKRVGKNCATWVKRTAHRWRRSASAAKPV